MRFTRFFASRLAQTIGAGGALLAGIVGCSAYSTYKDVPVNCAVQDDYDYKSIEDFTGTEGWFAASDYIAPTKYDAGLDAYVPEPVADASVSGAPDVRDDAGAARPDGAIDASQQAADAGEDASASAAPDVEPDDGADARPPFAPRLLAPLSTHTSVSTTIATSGGTGTNTSRSSISITTIPEGPLCGNSNAGVFRATHNNDWGGMFGKWNFASTGPLNASDYEGISFWARAPGQTTKAFTLVLDDNNTYGVANADIAKGLGSNCRSYPTDGGTGNEGQSSGTTVVVTDPGTGTPITGSSNSRASYPDECGNSFFSVVELSSEWRLYTIPWRRFMQNATPNRVPNSALVGPDAGAVKPESMLLTFALRGLALRMPKEAEVELWMTKLAFYRQKTK
jgi:hypothetical protein